MGTHQKCIYVDKPLEPIHQMLHVAHLEKGSD